MVGYSKARQNGKRRKPKKRAAPRKDLERRLEDAIRELVFWRDGNTCIEHAIDGCRCGGGPQWGHFVPRKQSRWLKLMYYNTWVQCRDHNGLHDKGDQTMSTAIAALLGPGYGLMMNAERDYGRGRKVTEEDLKCRLEIVQSLLDHRPTFYDTEELVRKGYYGPWEDVTGFQSEAQKEAV